jgi:insertion element IS1 protein InsB
MDFMGAGCAAVLEPLQVQPVAASGEGLLECLEVEADELWSVVPKKATPRWLWLAMDKQTRQIIAFHVGDRSRDSAKPLWATGPAA